jgi:tripartite-type tricarboxylate transporter receptor subunit TctC
MPDIPTLDEQGLTGFDVRVWHGVYAPKGTPPAVINKLNAALRVGLQDDMVKQRLADLSSEIVPMDKVTPEALQQHLESEVAKWGAVIREAGIQSE